MFNKKLLLLMMVLCAQSSVVWGMADPNSKEHKEIETLVRCDKRYSNPYYIGEQLRYAAMYDDVLCVRAFLEAGHDPNKKDGAGRTALFEAYYRVYQDIAKAAQTVEVLTKNGARTDITDNAGLTPEGAAAASLLLTKGSISKK